MIDENKKEKFKKALDTLLKEYSVSIAIDSNLSIEEMEFAELDIIFIDESAELDTIFIDESADNRVICHGDGWLYNIL